MVVPLPIGATVPELVVGLLEMIVNEGPEHEGVGNAERVTMSFVDEGGRQALQVIVDSVAASMPWRTIEVCEHNVQADLLSPSGIINLPDRPTTI